MSTENECEWCGKLVASPAKTCNDYCEREAEKHKGSQDPFRSQVGGRHYTDMKIQPAEFILKNGLNWLEGQVIKYISRHQAKGGAEDLRKAIHCLEMLLHYQYSNEPKQSSGSGYQLAKKYASGPS